MMWLLILLCGLADTWQVYAGDIQLPHIMFVDSEARTAINSILDTLEALGFHATS